MPSGFISEQLPVLDIRNSGPELKEFFVDVLAKNNLPHTALILGQCSNSLSTAFFLGYQLAVRHLDSGLQPQQFAAFCASESGIKSSRDFNTRLNTASGYVTGEKSHVMLMQADLIDYLYVLANNEADELVCVKAATDQAGVTPLAARKPQPFVVDVPHTPVALQQATIDADFLIRGAHKQCFKPFRYWEDVLVGLSFAGWMSVRLRQADRDQLEVICQELIKAYQSNSCYYDINNIAVIDELMKSLVALSEKLSAVDQQAWQKDSVLLSLGSMARQKVALKLKDEPLR